MIKLYKQTLTHSCLVACFLMLVHDQATREEEQSIALRGSQRTYPFYVAGVPLEIAKAFNIRITCYADNKYFASKLSKSFGETISVKHEAITTDRIRELLRQGPVICHIDDNALGDYSHASHFIVLEKATEHLIQIIDPWSGGRRKIKDETLQNSILSLKKHIKMCPLLFTVER